MKDAKTLYNERLNRLTKAITLGKPDRTPVTTNAYTFCAQHLGIKMSKFSTKPWYANKTPIKSFLEFPTHDPVETPYDVYKYCTKLIKKIGPDGFILSPVCTLPMTAKVENVKAMLAAVTGK